MIIQAVYGNGTETAKKIKMKMLKNYVENMINEAFETYVGRIYLTAFLQAIYVLEWRHTVSYTYMFYLREEHFCCSA